VVPSFRREERAITALPVTPLAYSEEVDEVQGFDASAGRAPGVGHRCGLHPLASVPATGALVGGPERFARTDADADDDDCAIAVTPTLVAPMVLTPRDVMVLGFLAEGWTTLEIAHQLAYAESTIKKEVHLIVHHMGARNRTHAVAMAVRGALI
jgi:DNA-binding CsgD family transcriptional regulator